MKNMKTMLAALLVIAGILAIATPATVGASPLIVQPVVVPPAPARIAPLVLTPADAITAIAQIKSENNTVSLDGATVTVFPPTAILITEGVDAGKVRIALMIRPSPSPTPSPAPMVFSPRQKPGR